MLSGQLWHREQNHIDTSRERQTTYQSHIVMALSSFFGEHGRKRLQHGVMSVAGLSRNNKTPLEIRGQKIICDLFVDFVQTICGLVNGFRHYRRAVRDNSHTISLK